jgi:septal ring factor EnvC (AmiA/AmiB activator)
MSSMPGARRPEPPNDAAPLARRFEPRNDAAPPAAATLTGPPFEKSARKTNRKPVSVGRIAQRSAAASFRGMLFALAIAASATAVDAQQPDRVRQQREELERIRRERDDLQRRLAQLQGSVHDMREEAVNLERQADATARVVRSLDAQLVSINDEVDTRTADLVRAEDELTAKRAILKRRVADIYKRGPLYNMEVLLSAQSFGGLLARYKYLHLLALRDRAFVDRVELLRNRVGRQRQSLVRLQDDLERNRTEKLAEEQRLRELEQQRERSIVQAQSQAKTLQRRLTQIKQSEARVANAIGAIESARRRAEARSSAPVAASTLRTGDLGRLDWPVEGTILYRFGRVVNPNNTQVRWNGIGIGAPVGTTVRAIADGEVVVAEAIGTYGTTVIVQHGGGDYSVYGSLARADVRRGARVRKSQTIGTVGASDPEMGPHLHFEIRRERGVAVDPLDWLRRGR